MDIVEKLRGRSEYERHLGVELIYLYHMDVENICNEIERLREQVKELATALEFEANYDGHKLLARPALQQKDSE